jgi:hypothetical protein
MLIGPDKVSFFGVRRHGHHQIQLDRVGDGVRGEGGEFKDDPLH